MAGGEEVERTGRDLPLMAVLVGTLVMVAAVWALLAFHVNPGASGNLVSSILIVIFGFFFSTVSARIVGLIGSSSNPISGMTIATLMGTCLIFVAVGWTGNVYSSIALSVGAVIAIAAACAGATVQSLKTGYLVGGTPRRQEIGFVIGVLTSVLIVGVTLKLLNKSATRVNPAIRGGSTRCCQCSARILFRMAGTTTTPQRTRSISRRCKGSARSTIRRPRPR